jgi:putative SOS response-associated peptidase YedK
MCGKFTQMAMWKDIVAFSQPLVAMPEGAAVTVSTPMRMARVIRLDENGRRELVPMRWGFCKPRSATFKPDHMHARGETVDSRPRFCDAFGERRGILVVATFNEGEHLGRGKTKQWVIRTKDRRPFAIAVLWEEWEGESGKEVCFIQITAPANSLVSKVTDRMPAILSQKDWPVWLGESEASFATIKSLVGTFEDEGNWDMTEQAASRPAEASKANTQMDLF